jgi:hypothetical protein
MSAHPIRAFLGHGQTGRRQVKSSLIPYSDLKSLHAAIRGDLRNAIESVLDSGAFILGPRVEEFERVFAAYCNRLQ